MYYTNNNKRRDLEAKAIRDVLLGISFTKGLEIGCVFHGMGAIFGERMLQYRNN